MARRSSRPRFLSIIGLAAILLVAQIAATAGHLHLGRASHHHSGRAASLDPFGLAHRSKVPANHGDGHEQPCPLSWAHAVSASLLPPDPPAPALPVAKRGARHVAPPTQEQGRDSASAFHPRAPPAIML
jgi:hypothetical protein